MKQIIYEKLVEKVIDYIIEHYPEIYAAFIQQYNEIPAQIEAMSHLFGIQYNKETREYPGPSLILVRPYQYYDSWLWQPQAENG